MRKKFLQCLVFAFSFIFMSLSLLAPAAAAEEPRPTFLYPANAGDLNRDGKITATDARNTLRISANLVDNASEYMLLAADFNNDGRVSATDARSILRVSASLATHPYVEKEADLKAGLDLYVELMQKAKADKPAYSMIYYLEAPGDKDNRGFVIEDDELRELFEELMEDAFKDFELGDAELNISREDALKEKKVSPKGSNMQSFPLIGHQEAVIPFEHKILKDASLTELSNGNKQLKIVINNEKNPLPLEEAAEKGSYTSLMFQPMGDIEEFMPDASIDYYHFDCAAIIEYNPATKEIVNLKHEVNASLIFSIEMKFTEEGEGFTFGMKQNIFSTYEWFDFAY